MFPKYHLLKTEKKEPGLTGEVVVASRAGQEKHQMSLERLAAPEGREVLRTRWRQVKDVKGSRNQPGEATTGQSWTV